METVVLKEYKLFLVSSCGDRVFLWRWWDSTSTNQFQYLLVEIESSYGDGGTKRVQNIYSVILEETEPSCRDTEIKIKAAGQGLWENPISI